jgi:hypothetical protein
MSIPIKNFPDISNKIVVRFIEEVAAHLKYYDGKLIFLNSKRIGDLKSVGEFDNDGNRPIIKIAIKHGESEIISTLAHEYAHFHQYEEEAGCWKKFESAALDISDIFNAKINILERQKYANIVISVELDCEKRAIGIINQYHLPIRIDEYIKKANLGLFKWAFARKWGAWVKTTDDQYNKLVKMCPDTLLKSYKVIPPEIEIEFIKLSPISESLD